MSRRDPANDVQGRRGERRSDSRGPEAPKQAQIRHEKGRTTSRQADRRRAELARELLEDERTRTHIWAGQQISPYIFPYHRIPSPPNNTHLASGHHTLHVMRDVQIPHTIRYGPRPGVMRWFCFALLSYGTSLCYMSYASLASRHHHTVQHASAHDTPGIQVGCVAVLVPCHSAPPRPVGNSRVLLDYLQGYAPTRIARRGSDDPTTLGYEDDGALT
ncbi:hypothetical protein BDV93DRAFT_559986 [Ceratobasidium sp. AG-I]|nr:hypothetical protein BDV93DRAFT_559986 [Ceratobasidium sp. AG-I]